MDAVFDYADRYKHHPDSVPGLTWHEFLSGVERTGRYAVREQLVLAGGMALGRPVDDPAASSLHQMEIGKLQRIAWPHAREG